MKKIKNTDFIAHPIKREWFHCPICNTKLAVYDNTARSNGVFIKCKSCKNEIEIKIAL